MSTASGCAAVLMFASCDGRLLIMTSSHPEKLDAALLRANRIDRRWTVAPMSSGEVRRMARRFFPARDDIAEMLASSVAGGRVITASELQSWMVRTRNDPDALVRILETEGRPPDTRPGVGRVPIRSQRRRADISHT